MKENTETAVAVVDVQPSQPVAKVQPLFAGNPADVLVEATKIANVLSDVVRKQNLVSNIQGKEYPRCEAWTLLGTMLGVFPVLEWTREVDGGWEARVKAQTLSGAIVGTAEAMCMRSEKNWGNRDEYAIRSMAQTRATAKALRMPLGFVMTLGGFEACPAEEMTQDMVKPVKTPHKPNVKQPEASQEIGAKAEDMLLVDFYVEDKKSSKGNAYTIWTAKFEMPDGETFTAGTIKANVGEALGVLKGQICSIKYRAGKYQGTYELMSIAPQDELQM